MKKRIYSSSFSGGWFGLSGEVARGVSIIMTCRVLLPAPSKEQRCASEQYSLASEQCSLATEPCEPCWLSTKHYGATKQWYATAEQKIPWITKTPYNSCLKKHRFHSGRCPLEPPNLPRGLPPRPLARERADPHPDPSAPWEAFAPQTPNWVERPLCRGERRPGPT